MTKTVLIPDDVHILIIKKQIDIREKYGISLRISDMVAVGMRNIIDKMDELFRLGSGKTVGNNDMKIDENDGQKTENGNTENGSISIISDTEEENIKTCV